MASQDGTYLAIDGVPWGMHGGRIAMAVAPSSSFGSSFVVARGTPSSSFLFLFFSPLPYLIVFCSLLICYIGYM
jgi:hypothetical protein